MFPTCEVSWYQWKGMEREMLEVFYRVTLKHTYSVCSHILCIAHTLTKTGVNCKSSILHFSQVTCTAFYILHKNWEIWWHEREQSSFWLGHFILQEKCKWRSPGKSSSSCSLSIVWGPGGREIITICNWRWKKSECRCHVWPLNPTRLEQGKYSVLVQQMRIISGCRSICIKHAHFIFLTNHTKVLWHHTTKTFCIADVPKISENYQTRVLKEKNNAILFFQLWERKQISQFLWSMYHRYLLSALVEGNWTSSSSWRRFTSHPREFWDVNSVGLSS